MEFLGLPWTSAPILKTQLMLLAIVLNVGLALWCYVRLGSVRMKAYRQGRIIPDLYVAESDKEPQDLRVYNRLLTNQFELPVIFYVLVVTGLALGLTSWIGVILAFLFFVSRVLHAREMAGRHDVLSRRKFFIFGVKIIMLMLIDTVISVLFIDLLN